MDYAVNNSDNILRYIPLVKRIAGRIEVAENSIDEDDLVSAGMIGLMDAMEKYDESKSVPFEAYASLRIKGSMIDELRKSGKVSRDRMDKLNCYYRVKEEMEQELMRSPNEYEICEKLGVSRRELRSIHETVHFLSAVSFESAIYRSEDSELSYGDTVKDERAVLPENDLLDRELKGMLARSVDRLNEREKTILQLYYVEELTLKEIAYVMEVSVPRVSQLHGKILMKLRNHLSEGEKEI